MLNGGQPNKKLSVDAKHSGGLTSEGKNDQNKMGKTHSSNALCVPGNSLGVIRPFAVSRVTASCARRCRTEHTGATRPFPVPLGARAAPINRWLIDNAKVTNHCSGHALTGTPKSFFFDKNRASCSPDIALVDAHTEGHASRDYIDFPRHKPGLGFEHGMGRRFRRGRG